MKFSELQENLGDQSNFSRCWINQMCILNTTNIMDNFDKDTPIGFCFVDSKGQITDCTHTEHSSGMTPIYKD